MPIINPNQIEEATRNCGFQEIVQLRSYNVKEVSGSARTLIERIDFKSNECILDFCYKPKHENSYEKLKLTLKLNE